MNTFCHRRRSVGKSFTGNEHRLSSASMESSAHTLAIFAHELREPLGSILLAARALHEEANDPVTHREMSDLIERQGRYLGRLIDGALEDSRRGSDQLRLHKEWFDLVPVIRGAVEAVASLMQRNRHQFEVSVPSQPLYLMADPLRVQQVLVNLLANAAKYTPPGGSVHLGVKTCGEEVIIEVRDNGIGMVPSVLERVFDLFAQGVEGARSAEYSGLGVGLALVKSLVEGHGGVVRASSNGLGAGSSFVVRLPVIGEFEPTRPLPTAPVKRNILLVECCVSDSPMLDA